MKRSTLSLARLISVAAILASFGAAAGAQDSTAHRAKKILGVNDYTRWRTIESAQISGDGRWVASTMRLTNLPTNNSKPELHLRNLDTGAEVVIAHASNPAFSSDSRWIVYQVDSMPVRPAGRGGRGSGAADSAASDAGMRACRRRSGIATAPGTALPQAPERHRVPAGAAALPPRRNRSAATSCASSRRARRKHGRTSRARRSISMRLT